MVFRLRLFQGNSNIFLIYSFLLTAGIIFGLVIFYNNHQKQMRIRDYNKQMTFLSENLDVMEKEARLTSALADKLKVIISSLEHKKLD